MQLTLTEAADETGKSKSTLLRAISSGRLSASRNEQGDYRVDPSELFRVYPPASGTSEQSNSDAQSGNTEMVADLLEMVKIKDTELSNIRSELDETKERLDEHREAARALMSPEDFETQLAAERERLEQENAQALALKQTQHENALKTEREQQAKALAEQKHHEAQQVEKWEQSIAARKLEIQQARDEANQIMQREADQAKALKAERARIAALESRGLIARLLNKKPTPVG